MKTGTTISSKGIFMLNYSARPKKNIFVTLMSKVFLTTKKFWKTVKPFFFNKGLNTSKTQTHKKRSKTQTHKNWSQSKSRKYNRYLSKPWKCSEIKLANFHSKPSLKFSSVSELDVKKEILNLSLKKATTKGDISSQDTKKQN